MNSTPSAEITLACALDVPTDHMNRARYAIRMLLEPLGVTPRWTSRHELTSDAPGLYYGPPHRSIPERTLAIGFHPSTARYFRKKQAYPLDRVRWRTVGDQDVPILFPPGDDTAGEGFDIVASTFFWLAGWQEHTTRRRDRHGRFPFDASLQYELGTVELPVVDVYREDLKYRLRSLDVSLDTRDWSGRSWAICPTHDIDYLRKWRIGILYREVIEFALQNRMDQPRRERLRRLRAVATDAWRRGDTYRFSWERMQREEEKRGCGATYFLKTGAHGPYDVTDRRSARYLRQRIDSLREAGFEIGLHPSYHAANHHAYLERERDELMRLTGTDIRTVRQHYLRYESPLTTRMHASTGFSIDSTMGFADRVGFRRGTCVPHRYFDIPANRMTRVWSVPLTIMDSTLFGYQQLDVDEALGRTRRLLDTCRTYGGVCVLLWHNIIYDGVDGHGYDRHFEETLDRASASDAYVASIGDALDRWCSA